MLRSLFNKAAGLRACNFIKKRHQHRCFPVKFPKFLRTPLLQKPPVAASEASLKVAHPPDSDNELLLRNGCPTKGVKR